MLDSGVDVTIDDLARARGLNATYVSRALRLTLLAPKIPKIVEANPRRAATSRTTVG
jgi:hypothetical protein